MTMDGVIIVVIRPGIEGYLMTGEITIETIYGEDDLGIIIPFITETLTDIGGAVMGEMTVEGNILEYMGVIVVSMVVVLEDMVVIVVDTVVENKDKLFRKIYLYPITAGGRTHRVPVAGERRDDGLWTEGEESDCDGGNSGNRTRHRGDSRA